MENQALVAKIQETLTKRNLNDLIEVVKERLDDYVENCSEHEVENDKCSDPEDTCYRKGFEDDLSDVVELLQELNELKESL